MRAGGHPSLPLFCAAALFWSLTTILPAQIQIPEDRLYPGVPTPQSIPTTLSVLLKYGSIQVQLADSGDKIALKDGLVRLELPTSETALIIIDAWNHRDPTDPDAEPPHPIPNIRTALQAARANGMVIMHAPNRPVVDQYPQYLALNSMLTSWTQTSFRPHLAWPHWGTATYNSIKDIRDKARSVVQTEVWYQDMINAAAHPKAGWRSAESYRESAGWWKHCPASTSTLDISRYLLPLPGEYVVRSHEELRWVLWRHQIRAIFYTGGSLNECIFQRPTGINSIAGTDEARLPIIPVILGDCVETMETTRNSAEANELALLEYFRLKTGYTTKLTDLGFLTSPEQP